MNYQFIKNLTPNGRKIAAIAVGLASTVTCLTLAWPTLSLAESGLPAVDGMPGRREGGGTRSICVGGEQRMTALIPMTNLGKTISLYPTFFVYIPPNTAQGAEIGLMDEQGKQIYSTIIEQNIDSGVVGFKLPVELPPLEMGKNYQWYFQFICDDELGAFVEGWVQRVEVSDRLIRQLQQADSRQRAEIYMQEGLWYEALKTLAELRRLHPDDSTLEAQWEKLLARVKLEHLAQQPVVNTAL
ncbi:MAG: DUF928 domain-containing protein [Hormoscilla sp.]